MRLIFFSIFFNLSDALDSKARLNMWQKSLRLSNPSLDWNSIRSSFKMLMIQTWTRKLTIHIAQVKEKEQREKRLRKLIIQ